MSSAQDLLKDITEQQVSNTLGQTEGERVIPKQDAADMN